MVTISSRTRISELLKHNPYALESIISLSPRFEKLRSPWLRKIMAARTSIQMAAAIGGCSVQDFFDILSPLGFDINPENKIEPISETLPVPEFMRDISKEKTRELDVRSLIDSGTDPLQMIFEALSELRDGEVLKIINTFEPFPLIHLAGKQGYEVYSETVHENLVFTFFNKPHSGFRKDKQNWKLKGDWDEVLNAYSGQLVTVDVRSLEMPAPMIKILDTLENFPEGKALYVYHKRIPLFLLPELKDRNFEYRVKEVTENEVHLLIFSA